MNPTFYIYILILFILPRNDCYNQRSAAGIVPLSEEAIAKFLRDEYEKKATEMCTKCVTAEWNYFTDLTNKMKQEIFANITMESAKQDKDVWLHYFKGLDTSTFEDPYLVRQVERLSVLGNAALEEDRLSELTRVQNQMTEIYNTAKICPYTKPGCDLKTEGIPLDPDIENVMGHSRDYDELLYTWLAWRDATGLKLKDKFEAYVSLGNEAARANNFSDKSELWKHEYESPTLEKDLDHIWNQVSPLYNELHLYTLNKLKLVYQRELEFENEGLIPAHLLGNMWGQTWINLRKMLRPFPEVRIIDLDEILKRKNFTALKMLQIANEFYTSLGLDTMEMSYNTSAGAIYEKPKNKSMVCHASAWDFCNKKDFRIKMCAKVNFQDLLTMHHEMGHIQYYIQYSQLPIAFRGGANPGFHEAIGDTLALSVSTPQHLQVIGLISNFSDTSKENINALMDMALERVAFLPYGLLLDKWRWDVFSEKVDPSQWNDHYWHYREKYQKLKPPLPRGDDDFDAGSKFHVSADAQYASYFFAHILEFQIYRSLCVVTGQFDPSDRKSHLHKCDLYKNKVAGTKLKEGMKLGASKHWKYVLKVITGDKDLSGTALLEYFNPLYKYLRHVNSQNCN